MKKTLIFFLTAAILVSTTPASYAQKPKKVTTTEANEILQRIAGEWQVDFSLWQSKNKEFLTSKGMASLNMQHNANLVREHFQITNPDGSVQEGDGFLSYSEAKKRFEFVQVDNTGKSTILLTGQWYPENKTLLLTPVNGDFDQWGSNNGTPIQLQYVFFEDGSFMKAVRTPDMNGNFIMQSKSHYKAKI